MQREDSLKKITNEDMNRKAIEQQSTRYIPPSYEYSIQNSFYIPILCYAWPKRKSMQRYLPIYL